jgi:Flp pilus assembly protein TadG
MPTPHPTSRSAFRARGRVLARLAHRRHAGERGQSLVEFALILPALLFLLLGIVQFGFIFQAYITLSTATREAARDASIYLYDSTLTQAQNDLARNNSAKTSLLAAFNGMTKTAPNFTNGSSWTTTTGTGTVTATNGDITITYTLPTTVTDNQPRQGWRVSVAGSYHMDIMVPLIGALLPKDANGRFVVPGEVTMVIN